MSINWKKVLITWLKHHESHEICAFVFKYNSYSHFSTSSISSDVLVLFILKTIFRRIPDGLRGGILFQWFQKPTHLWSSLNFKRSIIYMTPNHFNKKMEFSFWMAIKMVKKAISTVVRYISTINQLYNLYSLNHLHAKINLNIYKIQFVWLKVAIKYPTCNRFELILRSHEQNIHMHIVHRLFTETIENYTKSVFKILIFFCFICRIHN